MNCGCNQLNDAAGVEALKSLYSKKGAGEVSFAEKVSNNLPVLGVGAGLGILGALMLDKFKKGGKK